MQTVKFRPFWRAGAALMAALMFFPLSGAGQVLDEMAKRRVVDVQFALQRLRNYGAFDLLTFVEDRGTVTLLGYANSVDLITEAGKAVQDVRGVEQVVSRIELLPPNQDDERIRWALYRSIYRDDFLVRYTPTGPAGTAYTLGLMTRFPGMQPLGGHAIHIIVKGRRVLLHGAVTSQADRDIAVQRAREVAGLLEVENRIEVR